MDWVTILGTLALAVVATIGVIVVVKIFFWYQGHRSDRLHRMATWFDDHQPHLLVLFLIVFVSSVLAFTFIFSKDFLPFPAAKPATEVVPLFNTTSIVTGITFIVTQILLFFFAYRYRTRSDRTARFVTGFLKLELLWTFIPAGMFLFLFLWGQILWAKISRMPEGNALEIEVVAEQFNWSVRYPGADRFLGRTKFTSISQTNSLGIDQSDPNSLDDFVPIQMHIPKNTPVKLLLRSKDVIHSFYIPYFRTKMDAVPGMTTRMHFTATTSTAEMRARLNNPEFNYEIACAELCGRMHFAMKLILVVDEPEAFQAWYQKQKSWMSKNATKPEEK